MTQNRRNSQGEHDDVAALVRLAGKRQPVPPERAERVRDAARAVWQREVGRRSRKRYAWTAAALLTAASLVAVIGYRVLSDGSGAASGTGAEIVVEALAGAAWARDGGATSEPRTLDVGDTVSLGSELGTGEGSRAAIRVASGHSVRLDTSTTIRLLAAGSLALDRGAIYVDSGSSAATAVPIEVRTPLGVVEEIGTQFEVRLEGDRVAVRLREGSVVVHHAQRAHELQEGAELVVDRDGNATRRAIPTYGADWEWIAGISPMLDLQGRSAREFLDWVARERGLTLVFADQSVARSAAKITLSGTTERLTLEEALDAVLPASRMTYRIEEGVLEIASAPQTKGPEL